MYIHIYVYIYIQLKNTFNNATSLRLSATCTERWQASSPPEEAHSCMVCEKQMQYDTLV